MSKEYMKSTAIVTNKYQTFEKTFVICYRGLIVSLLYPQVNNMKLRYAMITLVFITITPIYLWFLEYIYQCIVKNDITNLTRQITIGIVVVIFFFKTIYVNTITKLFRKLLDIISGDLLRANHKDIEYQKIVDKYIDICMLGQKCWMIIPILLTSMFPLVAGVEMIKHLLFDDPNKKVMVHEMKMKFIEDKQFESPYFEFTWIYMLYVCAVLGPSFVGFDGSFCISVTHAALKFKLVGHKLAKAFRDAKDEYELRLRVKDAIKDHEIALEFYNLIQSIYGVWLLTIFLLTSALISLNLYQISVSSGLDPKYAVFASSAVAHMFTPCYFANILLQVGNEFTDEIYNCPWERWHDTLVTRLLIIMIARSQNPLILSGNGIVYYNMELFVSILQSSYSFYTLIKP